MLLLSVGSSARQKYPLPPLPVMEEIQISPSALKLKLLSGRRKRDPTHPESGLVVEVWVSSFWGHVVSTSIPSGPGETSKAFPSHLRSRLTGDKEVLALSPLSFPNRQFSDWTGAGMQSRFHDSHARQPQQPGNRQLYERSPPWRAAPQR